MNAIRRITSKNSESCLTGTKHLEANLRGNKKLAENLLSQTSLKDKTMLIVNFDKGPCIDRLALLYGINQLFFDNGIFCIFFCCLSEISLDVKSSEWTTSNRNVPHSTTAIGWYYRPSFFD